jgi:DNA-directed RNA polymerase subunit beta'
MSLELVNQLLTKKEISKMIDAVYRACGQKETVIFCDRIMALGFTMPTRPVFPSARMTWSSRYQAEKLVNETRGSGPRIRAAVQ